MMPYGWEGNRRSGVAMAMRHKRQWFIHLRAQWLTEGRRTRLLHSSKEHSTLYLARYTVTMTLRRVGSDWLRQSLIGDYRCGQ